MPISEGARRVRGTGPTPAAIAFIGEAPGKQENYRGVPFCGKAGSVLRTFASWHGLDVDANWIGNVCQYWPGRGRDGKDLHPDEADLARDAPVVIRELLLAKPKVVVALGGFATKWFLPDNKYDMATLNGIPHRVTRKGLPPDMVVIPVTHPAAGLHEPKKSAETWLGLRSVARFVFGDPKAFPVWKAKTPPVDIRLWEPKTTQTCKGDLTAIDTEGSWRDPWCLSVCGREEEKAWVVPAEFAEHLVFPKTVIMHNAKHDVRVLRAMGVTLPRYSFWEDTMLMGAATAEHPYNLKSLAYRLLNVEMNHFDKMVAPYLRDAAEEHLIEIAAVKWPDPEPELVFDPKTKLFREKWPQALHTRAWACLQRLQKGVGDPVEWLNGLTGKDREYALSLGRIPALWNALNYVPLTVAVEYAGLDAWATVKLHPVLQSILEETGRFEAYRHDQYLNDSLVEMEKNGLPFDVELSAKTDKEFEVEETKGLKLVRKLAHDKNLNPRSPIQVSTALNTLGATGRRRTMSGNESTDEKTLEGLRADPKSPAPLLNFIDALLDYRGWTKLRSTYTGSLPGYAADGFIYPHLSITTAVSGRFSSEDPNLQNIPSRDAAGLKIRSCFRVKDEGHILLAVDLSQIELRLGAHLSNDPIMVDAFKTGKDLHEITRQSIFAHHPKVNDPDFNDFLRKPAKTANFSTFYGISPQALFIKYRQAGVKEFSVKQVEEHISSWFKLYKGVKTFLTDTGLLAKKQGWVATTGGKTRYLPMARLTEYPSIEAEAIRQAGNHRVQGEAGEVLKRVLHRWSDNVRDACNRQTETKLILQIHDELLFHVAAMGPDDPRLLVVARLIKGMMEAESKAFRVPITAECKVGRSWGEMTKLKI